jgi:hypothetical protein
MSETQFAMYAKARETLGIEIPSDDLSSDDQSREHGAAIDSLSRQYLALAMTEPK